MADLNPYKPTPGEYDYLARIEGLITLIDGYLDEIEAGRQGQASLNANFLRMIIAATGLPQALNANGFAITGLPAPASGDSAVTKTYADGLSFAAALPAQAGNARKVTKTDGVVTTWQWVVTWEVVSIDTVAVAGQSLGVHTDVASLLITLPAYAADAYVDVKDIDRNASNFNIRIDPGASAIEDGAVGEVMTISTDGDGCRLQCLDGAWRVVG